MELFCFFDFGNITQWKWEFGNGEISTVYAPAYTYDLYGNFSVQLTAATLNGCSISKSKTVAIKKVYVFAGNDTTVAALQPLQLIGTGSKNYLWTPNTQLNNNTVYNPIAVLNNDFTYNLKGTTAEGCIGYDSINIKVYKGPEIYVPTAFSPNGDGKNDIIKPIIPGVLSLEYFNIYNRWGQLIYSTQKVGEGWNGKWKSIEQPQGAYVWICRIKDYTGKMIERKGSFLLIH